MNSSADPKVTVRYPTDLSSRFRALRMDSSASTIFTMTKDIQWLSKYTPSERLDYIDREWVEVQDFIRDFGFQEYGTRKRS
jgi:hypothetical protein